MKLVEINQRAVDLMKKVKVKGETPEKRAARKEHAKKAIASNFAKGFIGKETHDRQMKELGEGMDDAKLNDMIGKLDEISQSGNRNAPLDMIYQWVKSGHANARQFRTLVNIWQQRVTNPPARM
jgi:hypothetical protein